MVWTYAKEGWLIYLYKDARDGATRQEVKRKTKEEIHAEYRYERRRFKGQVEMEEEEEDSL